MDFPLDFGIGVALAILALIVFAFLLGRKYKRLLSDEHLLEIWGKLIPLKAGALRHIGEPDDLREQLFATASGFICGYTIARENEGYGHQISLSYMRGPLAWAAAGLYIAFLGEVLSVDVRQAKIWGSERTIYDVAFTLSPEQQEQFAATAIAVPDASKMAQLRERSLQTQLELRPVALMGRPVASDSGKVKSR